MIIKGSNIILYKSDLQFGCSTDCSINLQTELKEITSQTSAFWREYKNNFKTWSVNIAGLTGTNGYTFAAISEDWAQGNTVSISMVFDAGTEYITFAGLAKIVAVELTGNYRQAGTYSAQLQGSGALTITNTITPPIISSTVKTAVYAATGGETFINLGVGVNLQELLFVARGSSVNAGPFITSGTPTGSNVKYTTGTSPIITFADDAPLFDGEFIRILYN